jgi:hypothetical protein
LRVKQVTIQVTANNQTEYNAILNACSTAEASGQGAITSLNINFPITILTYNLSLQQTGCGYHIRKAIVYVYE